MIVTLTLNPSLDLTYGMAEASLGSVDIHRAASATVEAGGKGVNVSRDLHAAGVATLAVLPAAGATGRHVESLLARDAVPYVGIPVAGETRINTSLLLPAGRTIKVNAPGPPLSREDLNSILHQIDSILGGLAHGEHWLVVAGSMPTGAETAVIGEVVGLGRAHGIPTAVDVSGAALGAALAARADLLAPNELELAELALDLRYVGAETAAGRAPGDETAPREALAHRIAAESGVELLVSLGSAGALHTDGSTLTRGGGPPLVPVNTAGAGDAFLAGWLAASGTPADRMHRALAWGRSACLSPTSVDPQPGSRGGAGLTVTVRSTPLSEMSTP